jgi:hypothetical protein
MGKIENGKKIGKSEKFSCIEKRGKTKINIAEMSTGGNFILFYLDTI